METFLQNTVIYVQVKRKNPIGESFVVTQIKRLLDNTIGAEYFPCIQSAPGIGNPTKMENSV